MQSTRQAARRLGVTVRQVRRYIEAGVLAAQQVGDTPNAPWIISDESLEHLVAKRTAEGRRPYKRRRTEAEASAGERSNV